MSGKPTSEWCLVNARSLEGMAKRSEAFWPYKTLSTHDRRVAAALRIAARVLDEGAVEGLARVIAQELGDDYDNAFASKPEWVNARGEKGGRFRDINEPMQPDYTSAAQAIITYLKGEGHDA